MSDEILNKIFYDILLKIRSKDSDKFKVNKKLIKKHLLQDIEADDEFMAKISEYLESFYDFCFVLEDHIMIEGKIDFKY